jgi:putative phosphoesterase
MTADCLIGLVSDTHGLTRPGLREALAGVSLILHAGDVGGPRVLQVLREIAPVQAVFGNVDDTDDPSLAAHLDLTLCGRTIHVSHGHELGSPTPERLLRAYAADIIVFGHTHRAVVERSGSRLVINPGAAGPRRFNLVPSVALLRLDGGEAEVRISPLE